MFWKVIYCTHSEVFHDRVADVELEHHFWLLGGHEDEGPIALDEEFHWKRLGKRLDALNEKSEAEMTGREIFVYVYVQ